MNDIKNKILLISPPAEEYLMKNGRCDFVSLSGCNWWPLILGNLGSFLEGKGYQVKLLDAQAEGISEEDTRKIISEYDPDLSVVMTSRESLGSDIVWATYLRDRKNMARSCMISPFILAPKAQAVSDDFKVDFVIGEPELGIMTWIKGETGMIKSQPLTESEYRTIPHVSTFLVKNCGYDSYMAPSEPYPFMDIQTGRGCSYGKCAFCLWPKTYRCLYMTREINDVMSEIQQIEAYRIFKGIMLQDDTLPEWRAIEFSEAKIKAGLKIPWSCYTRAEISRSTLGLMKLAGCQNLHVGYESGNDETLKRIRKGLDTASMIQFTHDAKAAGLNIHGDFMIGLDQTEAEIHNTIDFACKIRPHTAQFQVYIPFFGDKPFHDPDHLKELAVSAYKRYYGDPRNWPAVIKQLGKPRLFGRSIKSLMGGK